MPTYKHTPHQDLGIDMGQAETENTLTKCRRGRSGRQGAVTVSAVHGGLYMAHPLGNVQENVDQVLFPALGERVIRPGFGCDV